MAKKQTAPARTTLEEVNDSLTSTAQKLEQNKKYILMALGCALAAILLVGGFLYGYYFPNKQKALDAIGKADIENLVKQDTIGALKQYETVFKSYNNQEAQRAAFNAAIILYQQGKNKEAAEYLEKYSASGRLAGPAAQSLLGDCYVNMKQYDKAIGAFDKAIKLADNNELYAPVFMTKKATVLHELKKFADEAAIYQDIKDNYPAYVQAAQVNVDKYIERANALAGK